MLYDQHFSRAEGSFDATSAMGHFPTDVSVEHIDVGGIGRNVICDVLTLVDRKLSDTVLGFDVAHIFRKLCEPPAPAYYRGTGRGGTPGRWAGWQLSRLVTSDSNASDHRAVPGASVASVATYLEDLAQVVDGYLMGSPPRLRTWQGDDKYKPTRLPDKPHHPMPDLVLVDAKMNLSEGDEVGWEHLDAYIQFGDTGNPYPDVHERVRAYTKLAQAARLHFRFRPTLRFSLGAAIFGTTCAFVLFDRAGMQVSRAFDLHREPEGFLRVMIGLLYVNRAYLGFDINVSENNEVLTTLSGERWNIVSKIYSSFEIVEKGTFVAAVRARSEARGMAKGDQCIMKSYWKRREENPLTEVELLKNVQGLPGVIQLLRHEQVCVMGELDATVQVPGRPRIQLVHHRLILSPRGEELVNFSSVSELLSVFLDIVEAIEGLHSIGVVHRDVGPNNIVIARNPKSGRRRGILIDFDLAACSEVLESLQHPQEAHGTMPYIATQILNEAVVHNYTHDLESLFCTLCWISTTQTGPNNCQDDWRLGGHFDDFELGRWTLARTSTDMAAVGRRKLHIFSNEKAFKDIILAEFHSPYFDLVRMCAEDLRRELFPPALSHGQKSVNQPKTRRWNSVHGAETSIHIGLAPSSSLLIADRPQIFEALKRILRKWIERSEKR